MAPASFINRCARSLLASRKDLLGTGQLSNTSCFSKGLTSESLTVTNSEPAISFSSRQFCWWRSAAGTSSTHTSNNMTYKLAPALSYAKSPRLLFSQPPYSKTDSVSPSSWMSICQRHFSADSGPGRGRSEEEHLADDSRTADQPLGQLEGRLAIGFTCKICQTRCTKTFSKLSYYKGVVIIRCDGCGSNHLIADNLGWFSDVQGRNVEEILASKGERVKKLTAEGLLDVSLGYRGVKDGE